MKSSSINSHDPSRPPPCALPSSEERFTPEMSGIIAIEHLHRYAIAVQLIQGKDVLDIASGEGYGANLLANTAKSVTGVDISPEAIQHAKAKYRKHNLTFITGDCRQIPLPDASIDVVISFETVEHILEQEEFITETKRVLRPEGILLISTPNPDIYLKDAPSNPFHLKEIKISQFLELLQSEYRHVSWAAQQLWMGSVIIPQTSSLLLENFANIRGDSRGLDFQNSRSECIYAIALATNSKELPQWNWGCFTTTPDKHQDAYFNAHAIQKELNAIKTSTVWKLTSPIRYMFRAVKTALGIVCGHCPK